MEEVRDRKYSLIKTSPNDPVGIGKIIALYSSLVSNLIAITTSTLHPPNCITHLNKRLEQ
jgi:hypothetical protein